MIVENIGYLNYKQIQKLIETNKKFSIYRTTKNTDILVHGNTESVISLFNPKHDRLPWKIIEGKKITHSAKQVFNSEIHNISDLKLVNLNNGNQIIAYTEFVNY